eukprot:gene8655-biopygen5903
MDTPAQSMRGGGRRCPGGAGGRGHCSRALGVELGTARNGAILGDPIVQWQGLCHQQCTAGFNVEARAKQRGSQPSRCHELGIAKARARWPSNEYQKALQSNGGTDKQGSDTSIMISPSRSTRPVPPHPVRDLALQLGDLVAGLLGEDGLEVLLLLQFELHVQELRHLVVFRLRPEQVAQPGGCGGGPLHPHGAPARDPHVTRACPPLPPDCRSPRRSLGGRPRFCSRRRRGRTAHHRAPPASPPPSHAPAMASRPPHHALVQDDDRRGPPGDREVHGNPSAWPQWR